MNKYAILLAENRMFFMLFYPDSDAWGFKWLRKIIYGQLKDGNDNVYLSFMGCTGGVTGKTPKTRLF